MTSSSEIIEVIKFLKLIGVTNSSVENTLEWTVSNSEDHNYVGSGT